MKKDPATLLERFDDNRDGAVDLHEWEKARSKRAVRSRSTTPSSAAVPASTCCESHGTAASSFSPATFRRRSAALCFVGVGAPRVHVRRGLRFLSHVHAGQSRRRMKSDSVLCLGRGFHRMRYYERGDPANPRVLICVHGLTGTGRDFDFLAEALAGTFA